MADIYDQHKAAFSQVSAFVVLKGGDHVATIAIKFPRDGAGRLYAYVHWIGLEMVRGHANGYGYDKRTAAVSTCAPKIRARVQKALAGSETEIVNDYAGCHVFCDAIAKHDGNDWTRQLETAGFKVFQAV